jgi:hypothetical protein
MNLSHTSIHPDLRIEKYMHRKINGAHASQERTMKTFIAAVSIGLLSVAVSIFAQDKAPTTMDHSKMEGMHHEAMLKPAQFNTSANAIDAVAAVDRFSRALIAGQLDKASAELDAKVLILESGSAEHSAEEYLAGHAKDDAAFLKGMHVQLVRRTAQASSDMAWVASESEMHNMKDGKMQVILSTETMVLQRMDNLWKITHIHWSSRTK